MEVTYADGTREILVTDESWDVTTSHVTYSELYHGETVDLTAPITLLGKAVVKEVRTRLVAQVGEWITEQERLAPIEVIRTPNDKPQNSRLKLTAELSSGNERCKVNEPNLRVNKTLRDSLINYSLSQGFGNSSLTNSGLTDKAGVIFLAAAKNLNNS